MSFNAGQVEDKMKKTVDHAGKELSNIRTGRASTAIFANIKVEYYGSEVPLTQVANIAVSQGRTIEIKAWDVGALQSIEKAILKSDLGLTPVNDGKIIRLNIPSLTEERRKELSKFAKKISEDNKVTLRNIRRDANEELDKAKSSGMPEDEIKRNKEKVQKILNNYEEQINKLILAKEKEIMEV